jgi:hypothetical protein
LRKIFAGTTLQAPNVVLNMPQGDLTTIMYLDGSIRTYATTGSNGTNITKRWSFNLIEHVLRKYGSAVFGAAVTTVDRVTWLKANVGKVVCNWWGYGSGPLGEQGIYKNVEKCDNTCKWLAALHKYSNCNFTIATLTLSNSANSSNTIDSNGFVHFLAYADASDGTTASTINTDFVELEVNLLVQTLPTGYATTSWTPYKLSYQLATTVEEVVTVEGAINLHTGGNQIEVSEGVVVREKVTPASASGIFIYQFKQSYKQPTLKINLKIISCI